MRTGFVTSVAANIVSSSPSTLSGAAPAATPSGDDGFAAMLGDLLQVATPSADAVAPANDTSCATPSTPPAATQLPDASAIFLQQVAPPQGEPAATDAVAAKPAQAPADDSLLSDLRAGDGGEEAPDPAAAKPIFRANAADNTVKRADRRSEPLRVSADIPATPDAGSDTTPATNDPAAVLLHAAQQALPVASTPVASTMVASTPAASTPAPDVADASEDATVPAAASDPASLPTVPATDVAARAILARGTTVKPGKTDAAAPVDDEKSQKQASTAAAVADLGKAATRVFADPRASTVHALPVQPKNDSQPGSAPSGQPNPGNSAANTAANIAAPATTAEAPAANTAAPVHAAAQPDASAAANTASVTAAPAAAVGASAPAAPAVAQIQITHPSAAPDVNALAFTIASKSEGGARHFDIRLDPAELGRVDVRLTVDHSGQAQAALTVEKPQTLELLQKDQSHLERALKDAGLDLTQNGLSFSLKGQQQQNAGAGNDSAPRGRPLAVRAIAAAGEAASQLSFAGIASSDSRLDIRV